MSLIDDETISDSPAGARTYEVRTYGCQMNVHDSERLSGLLEEAGAVQVLFGALFASGFEGGTATAWSTASPVP